MNAPPRSEERAWTQAEIGMSAWAVKASLLGGAGSRARVKAGFCGGRCKRQSAPRAAHPS